MKNFLILVLALTIAGCSTPVIHDDPYNAIIPLGNAEVGIFIPESWKKLQTPDDGKNIVLMAQNGSDNVVISFEYSDELVTGEALSKGAETGFLNFTQNFVDENQCFFNGNLSTNTPTRSFWQKIIHTSESTNFLLLSCSSEQINASDSPCPEILKSFKILDKKD